MRSKLTTGLGVGVALITALVIQQNACSHDDGFPPHDGKVRQTVRIDVNGLRRGGEGTVALTPTAHFTQQAADEIDTVPMPGGFKSVSMSLVDAKGTATPLPVAKWEKKDGTNRGTIKLPEVPDGDYTLRAEYKTKVGTGQVEVKVPLYTPARIHVITDRPLYEPGNTVKFRAVALRASDLTPLEERPGTWRVTDAQGELLLEERAPTGPWGVVSGTFPVDRGGQSGTWTVTWQSGAISQSRSFTVKPFTLPRFHVEASPAKPFYRRNERPVLKGSVTYSSGAPVANAKLELEWNVSGNWPAPTSWIDGHVLPKVATTNASGAFVAELPAVPDDLQGQATLTANIGAVDAAGDRVEGSASILLSEDLIGVSGVTELSDGLVEGFNSSTRVAAGP